VLTVGNFATYPANSSVDFQLDRGWLLERLKREIALDLKHEIEQAPPVGARRPELEPEFREVREVVRRGDTFGGMLRRVGIDSSDITRWSAASRRSHSLSRLQPGHTLTFFLPSGTDRLAGLHYEVSPDTALVMRDSGGEIVTRIERLPRMIDVMVASGTVETTLYDAAVSVGLGDEVISKIVDVFGWEIDFTNDIQRGDTFRVAYEEHRLPNGKTVEIGRILAAELTVKGRLLLAIYFEPDDGRGRYYGADGTALGRAFLRYPLEFTRISSQFSKSRFHPVLRIRRPHMGVDFAAPRGTPVRTIGAGRVTYAGWKGGNGRFVKISHGGGVESSYSHLNSIAKGLRSGTVIEMGDVIGTVGSTGLATGAHLHFALWKNGLYVDPTQVKLPSSPRLPGDLESDFRRARDELLSHLVTLPLGTSPRFATRLVSVELAAR
jgi:murein DD-endopeptidase MepM/ murein hydrolase activator NlpD